MTTEPPKWMSDKPSITQLRWICLGSFIAAILFNLGMKYYWAQSNYPHGVLEMQLSFSADYLKNDYHYMLDHGNLASLQAWQIVDYGFMAAYGLFGFSAMMLIGRKFPTPSRFQTISYSAALIMILVSCLDAIENAFSLMTLADPYDFPAWWAIAMSSFALVKWSLGAGVVVWLLISSVILMVGWVKSRLS